MNTASQLDELQAENARLRERCLALEQLVRDHDLAPIPPVHLRVRVGGWDDPDHFLGVGRKIYWDVKRLLHSVGRSLADQRHVLDFGCGCGRLTRHLHPAPEQQVVGCDIDGESIEWCRAHLQRERVRFVHTPDQPPLPFDAASFDLVVAISVFTHLPESLQDAWLDDLARVTAPGAILIASTHGETLLPEQTHPSLRAEFVARGFLYAQGATTPGLPEFYQTTYHRADYVRAQWQRHFDIRFELPRGINNHQDAYVLVRR